jgi:hypothetical protein
MRFPPVRAFVLALGLCGCEGSAPLLSDNDPAMPHDDMPNGSADDPAHDGAAEHPDDDGGAPIGHDPADAGIDSNDGGQPFPSRDGSVGAPDAGMVDPDPPGHLPDGPLPEKRVVPIFITASDESEADTARYVATYNNIMDGVRTWYTDQLRGMGNYEFYHDPVLVLRGHYTKAQWDHFGTNGFEYPDGTKTADGGGCSMYYGSLHELTANGLLEGAGLPPPGTAGLVYYAILGGGTNGSCGAGGYLAASELNLLLLAEADCPAGRKVGDAKGCTAVGAIAHEAGHGFGLPHTPDRPACTNGSNGGQSIMQEWWLYDDVGMCDEERSDLIASGYFHPI